MLKALPVAVGLLVLTACAPMDNLLPGMDSLLPGNAGNPVNDPYAGSAGSVYDASANPPSTLGVVTYDPDKAVPLPAEESTPAAPSAGAMAMPMAKPAH